MMAQKVENGGKRSWIVHANGQERQGMFEPGRSNPWEQIVENAFILEILSWSYGQYDLNIRV